MDNTEFVGSHYYNGPVWNWFNLTYSAYLVVPRSLLCGMPLEWQEKFVALLDEMRVVYDSSEIKDNYSVILRVGNRITADPLRDYRHPPDLPYAKID